MKLFAFSIVLILLTENLIAADFTLKNGSVLKNYNIIKNDAVTGDYTITDGCEVFVYNRDHIQSFNPSSPYIQNVNCKCGVCDITIKNKKGTSTTFIAASIKSEDNKSITIKQGCDQEETIRIKDIISKKQSNLPERDCEEKIVEVIEDNQITRREKNKYLVGGYFANKAHGLIGYNASKYISLGFYYTKSSAKDDNFLLFQNLVGSISPLYQIFNYTYKSQALWFDFFLPFKNFPVYIGLHYNYLSVHTNTLNTFPYDSPYLLPTLSSQSHRSFVTGAIGFRYQTDFGLYWAIELIGRSKETELLYTKSTIGLQLGYSF